MDKVTLEFLLQRPKGFALKVPVVIFVKDKGGEDIAAVLLNEYELFGCLTGLYTSLDVDGEYTMIASPSDTSDILCAVSEYLLNMRTTLLLLLTRRGDQKALLTEEHAETLSGIYTCGSQTREVKRTLRLASSFEDTLGSLGADTRRTLRRYRRKLEECYSAEFISTVNIPDKEFIRFDTLCSHPVPHDISRWRNTRYGKDLGTFMVGLRANDGSWLSLVGGRRQGTLTRVDWQMNLVEHKGNSIVSAMRSWLIEHEIAIGVHSLRFERGTTHSSAKAFTSDLVSDVIIARSILSPHIIKRWLLRLLPRTGTLPQILDPNTLHWY